MLQSTHILRMQGFYVRNRNYGVEWFQVVAFYLGTRTLRDHCATDLGPRNRARYVLRDKQVGIGARAWGGSALSCDFLCSLVIFGVFGGFS